MNIFGHQGKVPRRSERVQGGSESFNRKEVEDLMVSNRLGWIAPDTYLDRGATVTWAAVRKC